MRVSGTAANLLRDAKVVPRSPQPGRRILGRSERATREATMGKRIDCECGFVLKAENDEELVDRCQAHVQEAHPELVGKLSRDDVLAMAVEDD
jgi:predicted small metal-binding protein